MLCVLIPTDDDEDPLAQMLPPLVQHAVTGMVSEVMVLDAGSRDETRRVAELAGCTIVDTRQTDLPDWLTAARAPWLLALEPGARLMGEWTQAVQTHVNATAGAVGAARFRVARDANAPWWQPWPRAGKGPFARGFLISKTQAMALARPGMALADLPRGVAVRTLSASVVPPVSR